jgi:RNA ligase (TIGR02306 family)
MTDIRAKVVEFDLYSHPDPEVRLLSIAKIRGTEWQCVVKTSDMKDVKLGIYIPIDMQVPVVNNIFSFLDKQKTGKLFRIKTIRLRQALSQGLLVPAPEGANLGDDVTDLYGITRWEPVIPAHLAGDMIRDPGNFQKYTSIENWKNYPNIFTEDDTVKVTEKLHGTSCRIGWVNDGKVEGLTYFIGSHKTARNKNGSNLYSEISQKLEIEKKLFSLKEESGAKINFIIFGEIYGSRVQDLVYDCKHNEQKFRIFDVVIDHVYQSWEFIEKVANILNIETVPLLYRGKYDFDKIIKMRDGKTTLGSHVREGIVVTSDPECYHPEIGRKILKFISDDYLLRKGGTDGH